MNMRSIYANPYKYACKCDIPLELAKIACSKHRHTLKEEKKHPVYCPACGSKHIGFEMGSYEEGYGDFFYCEDCDETFDFDELPNAKYFDYMGWANFDAVLFFSNYNDKAEGWREACGATTKEAWLDFAYHMITGRRQKLEVLTKEKNGLDEDFKVGDRVEVKNIISISDIIVIYTDELSVTVEYTTCSGEEVVASFNRRDLKKAHS